MTSRKLAPRARPLAIHLVAGRQRACRSDACSSCPITDPGSDRPRRIPRLLFAQL